MISKSNKKEAAEKLRQIANENYEPGSMIVDLRYRKKEQPTGEEVNSIAKFSRLVILNRTKLESAEIQEKIEKTVKITAALITVSTAVIIAAILAAVRYLK